MGQLEDEGNEGRGSVLGSRWRPHVGGGSSWLVHLWPRLGRLERPPVVGASGARLGRRGVGVGGAGIRGRRVEGSTPVEGGCRGAGWFAIGPAL
jgi:hypothetical protein